MALLVLAVLLVAAWRTFTAFFHPVFGRYHSASMSEAYQGSQTRWQKRWTSVRGWLHLPQPPPPQSPNGYDIGLQVGPAILGWSMRNNTPPKREGYIYTCDVSPSGGGAPLWQFALSTKRHLSDLTRKDLQCEFYGKGDPRGTNVFGTAWNGRTLRVPEGQVFLARLETNHSIVYAVQLARQGGTKSWGTMKIQYLIIPIPYHERAIRAESPRTGAYSLLATLRK